jgi:hypothetical protein
MAKVVCICLKNHLKNFRWKEVMEVISNKTMPDNIHPLSPQIIDGEGIVYGILNPNATILKKYNSVCLGDILAGSNKWWEPLEEIPDGSYALFRGNRGYMEIVSDAVGSRTIWYFKNESVFISSTSQRAIVILLKSFELNNAVIPWMLSSGTLGPHLAWDRRIKCLSGDSSLVLDRQSWTLTFKTIPYRFETLKASNKEHENALKAVLRDTFDAIDLDCSKWILPLSGGYDSRGILCLIKNRENLRTVTWGLKSSLKKKNSDAYIARALANFYGLSHEYYETDVSSESLEKIFNRFLICGEGRIDHISGYMDGFKIWKQFFESGIQGIVRGDNEFGFSSAVSSSSDIRRLLKIDLCSDFLNLKRFEKLLYMEQNLPQDLLQKEHESLEQWRDRLYHQFRAPLVLAALNDIKSPYVEIMNPFLSRKILYQIRKTPIRLINDKYLFKKVVSSLSPNINFAKYSSLEDPKEILKLKEVITFLESELKLDYVISILPKEFVNYLLKNIGLHCKNGNTKRNFLTLDGYIPTRVSKKVQGSFGKRILDPHILAFRAFIICRMGKMLTEDAKALAKVPALH